MFWQYLKFVILHKWYVYREGRKLGLGFWQCARHDMSKLTWVEFIPYMIRFEGPLANKEKWVSNRANYHLDSAQVTDYFTAMNIAEDEYTMLRVAVDYDFNIAWLHHIHNNPHHWNHWIIQNDTDGVEVIRMPEKYAKEMVADWR